ncbi:DUF2570 domain-containing protein [Pantoea coffeiphila]|uniref:DUF2570 domain-containing protein n=1 Tax=Pantoea coffeiphila TaxID=1465635 RepID=UPI001558DA53|nr:DUF2570 domain-containing protein [Pantoea coffeiphila]
MKALKVLAVVLLTLLAAAVGGIAWERHQRSLAEKSLQTAQGELKQTGDVLKEVRALRKDFSDVEARLKALGQNRNTSGESRRESIKTALDGNQCAAAAVPVADSLYRRAAEVSAADYSGAFARKPDGKN